MTGYSGFAPNTVKQSETKDWISFLLLKGGLYSELDYRVVINNLDRGFLECRHTLFNGKDKLSYKTDGLTPLSEIISGLNDDRFLSLMLSVFEVAANIDDIGHLDRRNIIYDIGLIFADESLERAKVIYIPANGAMRKSEPQILAEFYDQLKPLKNAYKNINTDKTAEFFKAVNKNSPPEEIVRLLEAAVIEIQETGAVKQKTVGEKDKYVLTGIGKAAGLNFEFNEAGEYVIGRSVKNAHMVIPEDFKLVSNVHCRILGGGENWFLGDMGSTNGTKLNGKKIQALMGCKLKDEDRIELGEVIEFVWKRAD